MRSAHTKSLISRKMHHSCVKLVLGWVLQSVHPVFVKGNKLLDAGMKLIDIEHWHIKVTGRFLEAQKFFLSTESLQFASLLVLYDADSLVDRDSIVQSCSRSLHLDRAVRNDFWNIPTIFFGPINSEHVVCHVSTKDKPIILIRLDLADIDLIYLYIRGLQLMRESTR